MSKAGRRTRRHGERGGKVPNYVHGRWTGPDVWTTGNGEPSAARVFAEQLGHDWRRDQLRSLFGTGDSAIR